MIAAHGAIQVGSATLRVENLSKRFPSGLLALDGVSFEAREGEVTVVLGHNGCGKSTLVKCVVRLIEPTSGRVSVGGAPIDGLRGSALRELRRRVAVVFQNGSLVGRRSALANVAMGCLGRCGDWKTSFGMLPVDEMHAAQKTLERVGMDAVAPRRVDTLSGGQAQRVAIARALHQRPVLLIADEPIASLDPDAAADVMKLLRYCAHEERLAVVCVLHQIEFALEYADRLIGMQRGRIAFNARPGDVSHGEISQLYKMERAS